MADPEIVTEARARLGARLAALRQAAGYTQESFARLTMYGRSTVANVERGRQRVQRDFWERCDTILQADPSLATEYDAIERLRADHSRTTARSLVEGERYAFAQDKFGPCGGTAAIDVTTDLDVAASVWSDAVSMSGPDVGRLSRRTVLSALSSSMVAMAGSALSDPDAVRSVDPGLVEHFAALRAVLVASDNKVGAAAILPTAHQQLEHIAGFRRAASGRLHRDLLAAQAQWAEFVGWLCDDTGDTIAGGYWLGQALTMAQEAQDDEFTMYVFARLAQRAAHGGDQDRVLGLAAAAHRAAGHRGPAQSPLVHAFATLQTAHGHAYGGQTTAFQRAVAQAHTLADQPVRPSSQAGNQADDGAACSADSDACSETGEAGSRGGLGSFCTTAYVYAQEGDGWLRLGHPRTALDRFDRALAAWPADYLRDRGLYLARTAAAHAAAGDPEQAAATATQALHLAQTTRSTRIKHHVAAVARQLTTHTGLPAVADLHTALTTSNRPTAR